MYEIRISESLYELASQAARAQHVSVDDFVERAVKQCLRDKSLKLTAGQIAKVLEAQEDVKAGRVFTPEDAKDDLVAHRTEWLARHPH